MGSWWDLKENMFILREPGENNQELLWEHEKQFWKNLEFYWSWRSSISLQPRPKLLELWFICHWPLKSHVPWTRRRIRILWVVGTIIWLEIEILENLFWTYSHAESRFCCRMYTFSECMLASVEWDHKQHPTLWAERKAFPAYQQYPNSRCRQSELYKMSQYKLK